MMCLSILLHRESALWHSSAHSSLVGAAFSLGPWGWLQSWGVFVQALLLGTGWSWVHDVVPSPPFL